MVSSYEESFLSKKPVVVILLLIFSLAILVAGFLYYLSEEDSIMNTKYNELKAIAHLKKQQIVQWRNDRNADATVISRSPFFMRAVEQLLQDRSNLRLADDFKKRLLLLKEQHKYENIMLTDINGNLLSSAVHDLPHLNSYTTSKVKETDNKGEVNFIDFYICTTHKKIHYDVIAPIINDKSQTIAALVFRTDLSNYLYPLIQEWPTPSKSSETLLLRRDGDSVLFLNELRHRKNSLMRLRISIKQKEVPAVRAALGYEGLFTGRDYRGVEVLSYLSSIPNTPWFMVSKVDKDEIFSDLRFKAITIVSLSVFSIILLWLGLAFIYSSRQKNVYKTLWQTQQEARTTLYSIGDGVLIADEKALVRQLNPVAEELTGWKENEANGKPLEEVFNIIHEENRSRVDNPVNKVLKEGVIVELANHTLLISKNGNEIPIADSAAPIKNQSGNITGAVLVFRDQTKERQKQKALEESEAKYRSLFTSTNDGICLHEIVFDNDLKPVDYIILDVNKKYEDITGLYRKDIVRKKATEAYQSKSAPFLDVYAGVALSGRPNYFETYYEPMDKHFAISVYSPGKGKFATVFQDITIRKKSEEALRQSEERLKRAQEMAHLGSWELDLINNTLTWTDEVFRIFGLKAQEFEASYEAFLNVVHPDDREAVNEAYIGSIRDEKDNYEIEHRVIRTHTGEVRFVHEKCEHYRDSSGKIIKSTGMVHDITERKLTQLKLEDTLNELKRSNKDLEQFAYIASHDLQEPLRMIKSYTDLIIRRYSQIIEGDHKEFFSFISDGASRMHQLVNGLLQYSRLTSVNKDFELVDLNLVVAEVLKDLKMMIEDSNAKVIRENLPEVYGDKTMLRQLFQNLIQNSIKFRSKCNPEISISCNQKDSGWLIKIKDNGIGIAPEYHDRIFLIFQRLHTRDKYPGTGIGLAVCKRIVQHHGGEICLDSEEGKGTTFYFTIPLTK